MRLRRGPGPPLLAVAALAAVLPVALVVHGRSHGVPRSAAASAPAEPTCASRLLRDWADGRIDASYPIRCYREARKTIPTDLRVYSSAPDDIAQALSRRIAERGRTRTTARVRIP